MTDGPFAETKELIAGFAIIEAASKGEAIEWVKPWPALDSDAEVEIEIRQLFELSDFTPGEAIEHHARLREQLAKK